MCMSMHGAERPMCECINTGIGALVSHEHIHTSTGAFDYLEFCVSKRQNSETQSSRITYPWPLICLSSKNA